MSNNDPNKIHLVCTAQVHTCGMTTDSQIKSVSESLSASANYLRKLVLGETQESTPIQNKEEVNPNGDKASLKSTISSHADTSFREALIGFTDFDSKDVDTASYSVKRQAYEEVRQNYPNLDDLIRDEKVKALKEIRQVGFRYYTIQVTAFVEKDGLTRTVSSKSHHRLEAPSQEYLNNILTNVFKGVLRSENNESSQSQSVDSAASGLPDA